MHDKADHWETVYATKAADAVSWYQADPSPSLGALERHGMPSSTAFIDVGGGASVLVDSLLDLGWTDVTVLDISAAALEISRTRLGPRARQADWIAADITCWRPARVFDIWHDRAVFHFLVEEADRQAYCAALLAGLRPGGLLVMATFALDGPEKCSDLPIARYDPAGLRAALGAAFEPVESWSEGHQTPWGAVQQFNWSVFRRSPSG